MNTKEIPYWQQWIAFFAIVVVCQLLSSFVMLLLNFTIETPQDLLENITNMGIDGRVYFRWVTILTEIIGFVLPAFIFVFLFYPNQVFSFLKLNAPKKSSYWYYAFSYMLLSLPIIGFLGWVNMQIPLPESVMAVDTELESLINGILNMENSYEFFQNILLIALMPAIGEELLFRGVLQNMLLKLYDNPHVAIIFGAIIFSAFHMQFTGFLPRLGLGMLFGYMYYYSNSIWIPMLLHFLNNGFMVLLVYYGALLN